MFKREITGLKQVFTKLVLAIMLSMTNALAFAQEKGVDVDINIKKESAWYQQPWVWIVGAAVFILLLVAILRSGTSKQ
ncbi:hypothetical protein [Terrimonas alba]|uniref:hypothetical protein n=1 Tax=Terrimonas alba TaxID=3349636 RepID=UPI0035F4DC9A